MAAVSGKPCPTSSSESDPKTIMGERKRKRMLSNRESARRSRMRKLQHLDELVALTSQLQGENGQIVAQISLVAQQYSRVESENAILRTQHAELTERLQSATSVLRLLEEVSGMVMDIPEVPDPLLRPWQLPCPSQAILATPNMFQC